MSRSFDPGRAPTFPELAHDFVRMAVFTAFVWVPLLLVAFAFGRKRFGLRFMIVLTAAEGIAMLVAIWIYHGWWSAMTWNLYRAPSLR